MQSLSFHHNYIKHSFHLSLGFQQTYSKQYPMVGIYAYLITRNLQYNIYTMKLNCFIRTGMYIIMSGKARDGQTVAVNGSELVLCAG